MTRVVSQGMFAGAEVANRGLSDICPAYSAMKDMLDVLHFCKGKNHDNLEWGVESTVRHLSRRASGVLALRPGAHVACATVCVVVL